MKEAVIVSRVMEELAEHSRNLFYCMYSASFIVFMSTNEFTNIYHNNISLYNVYSYMFRHLYVIFSETISKAGLPE